MCHAYAFGKSFPISVGYVSQLMVLATTNVSHKLEYAIARDKYIYRHIDKTYQKTS